jgi:hypothetical protein|tara:strand:- start:1627 stop:1842 length:216 start_codon:yes stop_codon:yes gene_type:complete
MMSNTFIVPVFFEEIVDLYIDADSPEEAEKLASKLYDEDGGSFIDQKTYFKQQKHRHREWWVVGDTRATAK